MSVPQSQPVLSVDELAFVQLVVADRLNLKRPEDLLRQTAAQCFLPPPAQLEAGIILLENLEEHWRTQAPTSPFRRRLVDLASRLRTLHCRWLELAGQALLLQQQLLDLAAELLPAMYLDLPLVREQVATLTSRLQPLPASEPPPGAGD